jgi:hypothetical protein
MLQSLRSFRKSLQVEQRDASVQLRCDQRRIKTIGLVESVSRALQKLLTHQGCPQIV